MVQETVGPDLEDKATLALAPGGVGNRAAVIVAFRGGSFDGERPERMTSLEPRRSRGKAVEGERFVPDKLVRAAKRG